MLQKQTHPHFFLLGWGWFKRSWFKAPGHTGETVCRLDTVVNMVCLYVVSFRQICAAGWTLCFSRCRCKDFSSLAQPFQHRLCKQQTCSARRATLLATWDHAILWRGSGTTYLDCPVNGILGLNGRCARHAAMQMSSQRRSCRLRAWRTGVDARGSFSTAWRSCPTRTTTPGHTWRAVQGYRTSPTVSVKTNHVHVDVGRWIVITVFTWQPLHTLQATGGVVDAVDSVRTTIHFGYTIVHSYTFVETTCAGTTATLWTARIYRWFFAPSTTA
eukprot:3443135-Amphidinium_carterae.1